MHCEPRGRAISAEAINAGSGTNSRSIDVRVPVGECHIHCCLDFRGGRVPGPAQSSNESRHGTLRSATSWESRIRNVLCAILSRKPHQRLHIATIPLRFESIDAESVTRPANSPEAEKGHLVPGVQGDTGGCSCRCCHFYVRLLGAKSRCAVDVAQGGSHAACSVGEFAVRGSSADRDTWRIRLCFARR
jgi:hypothetical protein